MYSQLLSFSCLFASLDLWCGHSNSIITLQMISERSCCCPPRVVANHAQSCTYMQPMNITSHSFQTLHHPCPNYHFHQHLHLLLSSSGVIQQQSPLSNPGPSPLFSLRLRPGAPAIIPSPHCAPALAPPTSPSSKSLTLTSEKLQSRTYQQSRISLKLIRRSEDFSTRSWDLHARRGGPVRTAFTWTQERLSPWRLSIMRISFVSFVHLDSFCSFCCSIIFVVVSFVSVVVPTVCHSYLCPFVPFLFVSKLYKYPDSCTILC